MILNYVIQINDENKRLSDILRNKLYISKNLLLKLKNGKCIFVNDKITATNYITKFNDAIMIDFTNIDKQESSIACYDIDLDVLYEDDYLLIVNKPPFIPIHPCGSNKTTTLANALLNYFKKKNYNINTIHILTRLDTNTSGICLVAKNEYIQELFKIQSDSIQLKKEYTAFVNNILPKDHDIIENYICRDVDSIITRTTTNDPTVGKYAKTEYFVLNRNIEKNYTKVKIILHTGRTHQIRVHFASNGYVLLGDDLYANRYDNNYSKICNNYIARQALHCSNLSFIHPITNENIIINSNLYNDFPRLN